MSPKLSFSLVLVLSLTGAASAGTIHLSGNFTQDDNVVLVPFTLTGPGPVTIDTTSFANGSLGFEPVLTVYDGAGNLLLQDATGGTAPGSCGGRSIDSVSGFCLDAMIQSVLSAGNYTLALTEWDNIPSGPTLADGFPQSGNGNFTGPEFKGSPGSFILFNGSQRTSAWALDVVGASVPEPATFGLAGASLVVLALARRRRTSSRGPLASA